MVGSGYGNGGGGGNLSDLDGYATQLWVNQNFVSKNFFARLFTINGTDENDDDVVVEPNDLETTITNIQSMVGLWTEEYLSALGIGSGGGGGGGILTEPLATINMSGLGSPPSGETRVIAWTGSGWAYRPFSSTNGTVTSVKMTVPTGFKVSSGDSQTITNSGTFALTFGGTITKNQVLASPAAADGTPLWRALVADDIPDLSSVYASAGSVETLEGYFDANGNANSALKLTTVSKTAWGRTYWTANGVPDSIDGNMSSVGNISFAESGKNIGGIAYFDTTNGRLGIDKSTPTVTLDVGGYTKTTRLYLADNVYLVYDLANGGVHLVGAGLYADTYLSALGAGSGGGSGTPLTEPLASINEAGLGTPSANHVIVSTSNGWEYRPYSTGGSGITMNDVWNALNDSTSEQINSSHLSTALSGYLPLTIPSTGKTVNMPGIGAVTFKNTASNYPMLRFEGSTSGGLGFIGIGKTGNVIEPYYITVDSNGTYTEGQSQWYMLLHSGNMDSLFTLLTNSGDNISITVGGVNKTMEVGYAGTASRLRNLTMAANDNYDTLSLYTPARGSFVATNWLTGTDFNSITLTDKGLYDTLVSFGYGNRTIQLKGSGWSDDLKYRHVYTQPGTQGTYALSPWKTFAFTDGTIAKADRLSDTATKSAWGQTYWNNGQPQNISGDIDNVDEIFMNNNKFIRIKDNLTSGTASYINMIGMDGSNNFSVFWGALAKEYSSGIYGYNVYVGHGRSDSNPQYYTSFRYNGHVTINAYDKTGYFLTVGGNVFANTVVGKQLKADEGTAGETVTLNTSAGYDCIVYQINGSSQWSVGTNNLGTFYWYTQHSNTSVMTLTKEGHLTVKSLQIGDITITVEEQNNTSIGLRVSKGLSASTYISALGTGSGGGGGGVYLNTLLTSLNSSPLDPANVTNKVLVNSNGTWTWQNYVSGSGSGTVTSVGLTMPTGFTVTGTNPITGSGTFTVTANGVLVPSLNADKLDGYDASGLFETLKNSTTSGHTNDIEIKIGGGTPKYLTVGYATNANAATTASALGGSASGPFMAWGQTYWSSGTPTSISGEMSGVTSIDSLLYFDTTNTALKVANGSRIHANVATGEYPYFFIGSSNNSGWVYLADCCGQTTASNEGEWSLRANTGEARFKYVGINGNDTNYRLYVNGNIRATATSWFPAMELFGENGTPYIDFHYGMTTASDNPDYTSRIISGEVLTSNNAHDHYYLQTRSLSGKSGFIVGNNTNGDYIKIGGATLTWVAGQGLKIDTGFWSESFVSALGAGSGGGSGSGITMADVWSAMATPAPSTSQEQIEASHLTQALSGYATRTWANKSFVTQSTEQTITGAKTFTAAFQASSGAKFQSVRIECGTNGSPAGRTGEINRSDSLGLCLQYDNAYNVDMCHGGGQVIIYDDLKFFYQPNVSGQIEGFHIETSNKNLYVGVGTGNALVSKNWITTSDIRKKDVINPVTASVEDIANVRIFDFRWKKDGENGKILFGSAAQDWQPIFPHAVVADNEGFLSMDYGGIAVGAVKTVAQEVVLLKNRVEKLEKQLKAS